VRLLGLDVPSPAPADVGASFNLYWQALDALADDYQVALRIRDASGTLWANRTGDLPGIPIPQRGGKRARPLCAYTVPLLAGAPAGEYYVEVNFYTASEPSGLDVLAPNGAPVGKTVKLGRFPFSRGQAGRVRCLEYSE